MKLDRCAVDYNPRPSNKSCQEQYQDAMNQLNGNMGAVCIKLTYLNKCLELFAHMHVGEQYEQC